MYVGRIAEYTSNKYHSCSGIAQTQTLVSLQTALNVRKYCKSAMTPSSEQQRRYQVHFQDTSLPQTDELSKTPFCNKTTPKNKLHFVPEKKLSHCWYHLALERDTTPQIMIGHPRGHVKGVARTRRIGLPPQISTLCGAHRRST